MKTHLVFATVLTTTPALASNHLIDVKWDANGRFTDAPTVAATKIKEACVALKKGEQVRWTFASAAPVDFNIHYHLGKDVIYPAREAQVAKGDGTVTAALDQDYCWMWRNKGGASVDVRFELQR